MPVQYVDRFDNGDWITVPSIEIDGFTSIITGKWIKQAILDAEDCNERELPNPHAFIEQLQQHRRNGFAADIFTFAQKLPSTARKYPYSMEGESIAAIRLTTFTDWWDGLPQESRKNVRRAAKRGVDIRLTAVDDDLVHAIVEINNETPVRQGRRFTHYGESFDHVKRDFLAFSERSDLLCAYVGPELIGLAKVIYCGEIAAIMKLQTKISHADKRPANALIAAAIERCYERRAPYVTYGLYRYGNQAWTSLMEFKARHGFEEVLVPRYYVPLSLKGAVSARLNLHRGTVGILPPALVQIGRTVRARWTSRLQAGVAQR